MLAAPWGNVTSGALRSCPKAIACECTRPPWALHPPLVYFNGATVECMHRVKALARDGRPVFFTVDAGPQVKAVCLPDALDEVCDALGQIPGVLQVLSGDLGGAARLIPD